MRGVKIFSGSSHPVLASLMCERLGMHISACELTKFSNGETSVSIGPSIRNHDVYIVQSGSKHMNDSVMELMIMASACKGGSARSITAVLPYFPYCRQSKKKSHRGAITARMLANLLHVAGVDHVITVDLHADPIKGFFGCPVDNLRAEPLIARWIRSHVPDWQEAVVVSKNAGGSKRTTSMADALKLSFGIITTDRRRFHIDDSLVSERRDSYIAPDVDAAPMTAARREIENKILDEDSEDEETSKPQESSTSNARNADSSIPQRKNETDSPLRQEVHFANTSTAPNGSPQPRSLNRQAHGLVLRSRDSDENGESRSDERAREVVHGRLIQGRIVDDNYPSPSLSTVSSIVGFPPLASATPRGENSDPMAASFLSAASSLHQDGLGGGGDGNISDDEEASLNNPEIEHTITLVGSVKDKTVFLIDDMIDRAEAWIAAAETAVKRGGANKVYCIATHGLFGGDSLELLENCSSIDYIVVCNTFPIDQERVQSSRKLVMLDISSLVAEAIRRNHYGESISNLYQFYQD